ncbi:hypothetical protein CDAR_535901 [Caerostris darwini]|uniref:Uncharacterized protein n=1 Tax=Caerostris darwini TaxID=1538125 RepID=A0AAV4QQ31_9ARAC|nr:hypothetical protein CDAR_535901 [Caerostris darwini]
MRDGSIHPIVRAPVTPKRPEQLGKKLNLKNKFKIHFVKAQEKGLWGAGEISDRCRGQVIAGLRNEPRTFGESGLPSSFGAASRNMSAPP